MTLVSLTDWLQSQPLPTAIQRGAWEFPTIETTHVIAFALVVGSILVLDLRLIGLGPRDRRIEVVARQLTGWSATAFAVAAVTGLLLFSSRATTYVENGFFVAKMAMMALAGLNMAIFHITTYKNVAAWNESGPPLAARIAGGLSLLLWVGVICAGRAIGFTT